MPDRSAGRCLGRADPGVDGADRDDRARREDHRADQEPGHVAVLGELHQTLAAAAAGLDPGWDERFVATRRLIAGESALLAYVEHYRAWWNAR